MTKSQVNARAYPAEYHVQTINGQLDQGEKTSLLWENTSLESFTDYDQKIIHLKIININLKPEFV